MLDETCAMNLMTKKSHVIGEVVAMGKDPENQQKYKSNVETIGGL